MTRWTDAHAGRIEAWWASEGTRREKAWMRRLVINVWEKTLLRRVRAESSGLRSLTLTGGAGKVEWSLLGSSALTGKCAFSECCRGEKR